MKTKIKIEDIRFAAAALESIANSVYVYNNDDDSVRELVQPVINFLQKTIDNKGSE